MRGVPAAAFIGLAGLVPGIACAQRATENAVAAAEDAFGGVIGLETTGIYTENDTRGFSPLKAGNVRLDGIYFDQVTGFTFRLRPSSVIRVGFAALDYPFPAPTGIVDNRLRTAANDFTASAGFTFAQYGGHIREIDFQVPLVRDTLAIATGITKGDFHYIDGTATHNIGGAIKPVLRFGGAEFSPFFSTIHNRRTEARPVVITTGAFLPPLPPKEYYFGQKWAKLSNDGNNMGATLKAQVTPRVAFRGGVFRSSTDRFDNFTEIFQVVDPSGLADHRLIADPEQKVYSDSWEGQLSFQLGGEAFRHTLILGGRGRHRHTETGGSDARHFGQVVLGERDPELEPEFVFGAVNVGTLRQTALMAAYIGRRPGLGQINLGIQRVSYSASFETGAGLRTGSSVHPWLFNASALVELTPKLSVFAGTVRGLEDSGTAPETAINRNEQLPATRTTQYDGGLRWTWGKSEVVLTAFQIEKPYFSFDAANRFTDLGTVRHRGLEFSLAGHFLRDRLTVLAGLLAMDPVVTGEARDLGIVGKRPAGTPQSYARIDINYRTDFLSHLTPTAAFVYTGRRAVSAQTFPQLDGNQLTLDPIATVDLGVRNQFRIGKVPASFRLVVANVFDAATWKILASNTLQADDRRRLTLTITADF